MGLEDWLIIGAIVAAGVAGVWHRFWLLGRQITRAAEQSRRDAHPKYIGLDQYRERQQKQRYRDRVS